MSVFLAILEAISALPKIGDLVMQAVSQISAWYCSKQTGDTLRAISDAAALAARAKTNEDRFKAAEAWRDALSHDKLSS